MKSNIQVFLEESLQSFLTIAKLLVLSRPTQITGEILKKGDDCIILGNGPSLKEYLNAHFDSLIENGKDLFCVNYFCKSEFYEKLKPSYYVLNAPEFWLPDVEQQWKNDRQELIANIVSKTNWEMVIFLPVSAKKFPWFTKSLQQNKSIRFGYYNSSPVEGFRTLNFLLYKYKLGMPRPHNVLIPALMIAIYLKFKNIYLLGADHSWLKEINVTEDNVALLSQPHFYDSSHVDAQPMHKLGKGSRKLHEILIKFVYAFSAYFEIDQFAKNQKINIYNATKGSYIDAFERKPLTEIMNLYNIKP